MSTRPASTVTYNNPGRVVVVTGACGGIGRSICRIFARSGASVVGLDMTLDQDAVGDDVELIKTDVSRAADCRAAMAAVTERHGTIDVLVNTAGIQPSDSYVGVHELPEDVWDKMVGINLSGYTYCAKYALPSMLRQQSGVIINIGSGQAHRTARDVPAYGPLKAGNVMQSLQWGIQYARHGIRVVSVSPGAILTPMLKSTLAQQGGGESLANRHPLGRLGRPQEIAAAVAWLASDDASFITATDLAVDGGLGAFGAFADPYDPTSMPPQTE